MLCDGGLFCGNRDLFNLACRSRRRCWHGWVSILDPSLIGTILDIPGLAFIDISVSAIRGEDDSPGTGGAVRFGNSVDRGRFHFFADDEGARCKVRIRPVGQKQRMALDL